MQRLLAHAASGGTANFGVYANGIVTVKTFPNNPQPVTGGEFPYSANTPLNSFHPGGINVLMTDGAVRSLADRIEFGTLAKLAARDDGLPVTAD